MEKQKNTMLEVATGTPKIKWNHENHTGVGTLEGLHPIEKHSNKNPLNILDLDGLAADQEGFDFFWIEELKDSGKSDVFSWAENHDFKIRGRTKFLGFKMVPDIPGWVRYWATFKIEVEAQIGYDWDLLELADLDSHVDFDDSLPRYPYSIRS